MEERKVRSERVFCGRLIKVRRDTVLLPDGKEAVREVVDHPGSVGVVALDEKGRVVLVEQFRYPAGEGLLEIPAGTLKPGEEPLLCAKRELAEEAGLEAEEWEEAFEAYLAPGYTTELMRFFLARRLKPARASPDEDEIVKPVMVRLEEAVGWVEEGRIKDAKTIAALLWAWQRLKSGQLKKSG
ncbi:MAG TPA: NUDIX hydrolase [Armatimonadetes bacterium]|nr:NUDIX hydrolase [Armatimonadota bacterium]